MGKKSISAKALVEDIRNGVPTPEIMQLHDLSAGQFSTAVTRLVQAGHIPAEELERYLNSSTIRSGEFDKSITFTTGRREAEQDAHRADHFLPHCSSPANPGYDKGVLLAGGAAGFDSDYSTEVPLRSDDRSTFFVEIQQAPSMVLPFIIDGAVCCGFIWSTIASPSLATASGALLGVLILASFVVLSRAQLQVEARNDGLYVQGGPFIRSPRRLFMWKDVTAYGIVDVVRSGAADFKMWGTGYYLVSANRLEFSLSRGRRVEVGTNRETAFTAAVIAATGKAPTMRRTEYVSGD